MTIERLSTLPFNSGNVTRPEPLAAERIAVIGGGETAASMLNELFRHRVSTITVISPQVTLFTRGVFSARVQDALLVDDRIRHLRAGSHTRSPATGESD